MDIPIEQLLNLPDVRILKVEVSKREIRCDLESTRGFAICHRCGEKATQFFEHGETLVLRHLPEGHALPTNQAVPLPLL